MSISRRKRKMLLYVLLIAVVLVFCLVFGTQIIKLNHKNKELEKRKQRLEQLLADEELRAKELEDAEVYTKTKKFIEEKAKSIGYVYPDEIIFRKDN